MDQVVAQALTLVARLHGTNRLDVSREPARPAPQIIVPEANKLTV